MPRVKDLARAAFTPQDVVLSRIEFIKNKIYRDFADIDNWEIRQAHYYGPGNYKFTGRSWRKIRVGEQWGGHDITGFFRNKAKMPARFRGYTVVLDMCVGGGGQLLVNKKPVQGLDVWRDTVLLEEKARGNENYEFDMEIYVTTSYDWSKGGSKDYHKFEKARFAILDRDVESYYYDTKFVFDVQAEQDDNPEIENFLFSHLEKSLQIVDYYEQDFDKFRKSVLKAKDYLHKTIYDSRNFKSPGKLVMVANSHLDILFLWRYIETIRKNALTCENTFSMMKEYPDYRFIQSQARLYEDLKKFYPEIFKEVKKKIRDGQWEANGAMYVEPDCNLISGESFVRQILFGKRFFRRELGIDAEICWEPDVFGCAWTMPQILLKSGVKYFSTIKIHLWNDTNQFPYHTFWWQGPDGSRVIVHFPPTHFGLSTSPEVVKRHWDEYFQKTEVGESMFLYGWSDGGSGPTREMVEYAKRYKSFPGMPSSEMGTARQYFSRVSKKSKALPVWNGELYLETHRGTYTSQGILKKSNRKAEFLYRNAEVLSSVGRMLGFSYNQRELNDGWKQVLFNQFHDILPGSHTKEANADILKDYGKVFEIGSGVLEKSLSEIVSKIDTSGSRFPVVVFNTLTWERTDLVKLKLKTKDNFEICDDEGNIVPHQTVKEKGGTFVLFEARSVPSLGYRVYDVIAAKERIAQDNDNLVVSGTGMENKFFRIKIDRQGSLTSIYDKLNSREVLAPNAIGNNLQLFEDKPGKYSAWDILSSYQNKEWKAGPLKTMEVREKGPLRGSVYTVRKCLSSEIRQSIIIYRDIPRIDFETEVDWKEREKLLKVSFPVDVMATDATYDIPFGNIQRPTHRNTSWEQAKFEVCGHKWADLSEGDYGVSLMNDCKYGYDIYGNNIRLSLLKGPVYPNVESDIGVHNFTYSLYPHGGSWRQGGVMRMGYELNCPLISHLPGKGPAKGKLRGKKILPPHFSFVRIDRENVFMEAFKKAEDSDELILRFFDNYGERAEVNAELSEKLGRVSECNLMEEKDKPVRFSGNSFSFIIHPYEIKTFKVKVKK